MTIINQKSAQAYKGQSVIFTTDGSVDLFLLELGSIWVNKDFKLGVIVSIDYYGNSFKISPLSPIERFDNPGAPLGNGIFEISQYIDPS